MRTRNRWSGRTGLAGAAALVALLSAGEALAGGGESVSGIVVGSRVRVSAPEVSRAAIQGSVAALDDESLSIVPDVPGGRAAVPAVRVPRASITKLEIGTGRRRQWRKGLEVGAGVGAAMALPALLDPSDPSGAASALVGVGVLAAYGAPIGWLFKRETWDPVPLDQVRPARAVAADGSEPQPAAPLPAQALTTQTQGVVVGTKVRVRTASARAEGVVVGTDETAIRLWQAGGSELSVPLERVQGLEVVTGQGRRWQRGLLIGGAVGAAWGLKPCTVTECGEASVATVLLGAGFGASLGVVIGGMTKGDRWTDVPVGKVSVTPVALLGRGVGVGVSVRF